MSVATSIPVRPHEMWGETCAPLDDSQYHDVPHTREPISAASLPECLDLDLNGSVVIKSPMATGKTELIKQRVQQLEDALSNPRILIVSHRVSLIHNMAQRLEVFANYKDHKADALQQADKLIITPNSLHKLIAHRQLRAFDQIIIDESEQVLAHIVGGTMQGFQAIRANNILRNLMQRADHVLAMDAYASGLSLSYLRRGKKPIRFYHNTYRPKKRPLYMLEDRDEFLTLIEHTIAKANQPMFVASDSRKQVQSLYAYLSETYPALKLEHIHGGNSKNPPQQDFMRDINNMIPAVDMLIASPSVGVGVDIQTPVHSVFGLFNGTVLGAEDLMQMLGRCRNVVNTYVHLAGSETIRETDWKQLYQSFHDGIGAREAVDFDPHGNVVPEHSDDEYLRLYCAVESKRNASLNDIRADFDQLAKQVYTVKSLKTGKTGTAAKLTKVAQKQQLIARDLILTSRPVSDAEFQLAEELTPELEAGHLRWQIEEFYGRDVDDALLTHWKNGKGYIRLKQFVALYMTIQQTKDLDDMEAGRKVTNPNLTEYGKRQRMFRDLLRPIFGRDFHFNDIPAEEVMRILNGPFNVAVHRHDRKQRARLLDRRNQQPEDLLNLLKHVIRQLGMSFTQQDRGSNKSRKVYQLNKEEYDYVRELARSYVQKHRLSVDFDRPPLVHE